MKKGMDTMSTFTIYSNGCIEAQSKYQLLYNKLLKAGYDYENDYHNTDYFVFISCAGVQTSLEKTMRHFRYLYDGKSENTTMVVVGCFSKIKDLYSTMKEMFPDVYFVDDLDWVNETLNIIEKQNQPQTIIKRLESHTMPVYGENTEVYLFVSSGCLNHCSFCKTNYMNEQLLSILYQNIIPYVEKLVKNGTRLLQLHGTNLTQYGIDLYGKPRLDFLIRQLSKIDNLYGIGLHELAPKDFYPELIKEIQTNPKVNAVDIQIETASDRLLKLMDRKCTKEELYELVKLLRKDRDIPISTILMSAFPTEKLEDIEETLNFIQDTNIYVSNVCKYVNSPHIPSNQFSQLSKMEALQHDRYTVSKIKEHNYTYLKQYENVLKEEMVIAHKDNAVLLANCLPTVSYSYKSKYYHLENGSLVVPEEKKLIQKSKVLKTCGYRI